MDKITVKDLLASVSGIATYFADWLIAETGLIHHLTGANQPIGWDLLFIAWLALLGLAIGLGTSVVRPSCRLGLAMYVLGQGAVMLLVAELSFGPRNAYRTIAALLCIAIAFYGQDNTTLPAIEDPGERRHP